MRMRRRRFEVDRENGKALGVCAGIANMTGVDATFVRIGVVVLALATSFLAVLAAYLIAAVAGARRGRSYETQTLVASGEESRERMRNLDLRMQAIETYVTSSNSRLAREIEELR